jgi:hypothetical protein
MTACCSKHCKIGVVYTSQLPVAWQLGASGGVHCIAALPKLQIPTTGSIAHVPLKDISLMAQRKRALHCAVDIRLFPLAAALS